MDLIRLSVIDDVIEDNKLHLLRLVPRAWVCPDAECRFDNMPTEYGPVTLRFRLTDQGRNLAVTFKPEYRRKPEKVKTQTKFCLR